jgi:hypothetical protein
VKSETKMEKSPHPNSFNSFKWTFHATSSLSMGVAHSHPGCRDDHARLDRPILWWWSTYPVTLFLLWKTTQYIRIEYRKT